MPHTPAPHPIARLDAEAFRKGQLSRREFLTRATSLGVSGAVAYGLLGLKAPAFAQDQEPSLAQAPAAQAKPVEGGGIRVQMELPPLTDPRLTSWPQVANFYRGWLEGLVEYQPDGQITGQLLERWEVSEAASQYRLYLRKGVLWSNGEALTPEHVIFNLRRWCDTSIAGNVMAMRLSALIDPASGQLAEGAAKVEGEAIVLTLNRPDVTLMANLSDYPAVIVHPTFDPEKMLENPIGTGPWHPASYLAGDAAKLERRAEHWWNRASGGPWLEVIDYVDYGSSPGRTLDAAKAGAIDMTGLTSIDYIAAFDDLGWTRHEVQTAATLVVRFNLGVVPYSDPNLRRAIIEAVDNAIVLEIGHGGQGTLGENHHISPLHPDYAALPPQVADRAAAKARIAEHGLDSYELTLVSVDDDWQAATCDAVAVQCRDAGLRVTRQLLPASEYWGNWKTYPWAGTEWSMRPLGVQIMALGYRSNAPWNETGFADPEFDVLLDQALAEPLAEERAKIMAKLQIKLREAGVMVQPFWRKLFRHAAQGLHGVELHPMQLHNHSKWWREAKAPPKP